MEVAIRHPALVTLLVITFFTGLVAGGADAGQSRQMVKASSTSSWSLSNFWKWLATSESDTTSAPRTFGRLRKMQMVLVPLVFKFGVVSTLIMVLVVLSVKTILLLKTLVILNLGGIIGKLLAHKIGHHEGLAVAPVPHIPWSPSPWAMGMGMGGYGHGWGMGMTPGWGWAPGPTWGRSIKTEKEEPEISHEMKEVHVHVMHPPKQVMPTDWTPVDNISPEATVYSTDSSMHYAAEADPTQQHQSPYYSIFPQHFARDRHKYYSSYARK